jgi:hypothetical protein
MTTPAPQVQVAPLFAVPLAMARHPSPAALNQALRELFIAREAQGQRHRNPAPSMKTTAGVFESEFQLFNTDEPHISELRDFCWRVLTRVVKDLSGYPPEFMRQLRIHASAWFHVTRPGGYFGLHNHGMASWSGVYCVDGGDGGQELPDSALLTFNNPASTAAMFIAVRHQWPEFQAAVGGPRDLPVVAAAPGHAAPRAGRAHHGRVQRLVPPGQRRRGRGMRRR